MTNIMCQEVEKMEKEEAWKKYEEALNEAQEEYENTVGPLRREYERVNKLAFEKYKEDIERAREFIRDYNWGSEDGYTLKSY